MHRVQYYCHTTIAGLVTGLQLVAEGICERHEEEHQRNVGGGNSNKTGMSNTPTGRSVHNYSARDGQVRLMM